MSVIPDSHPIMRAWRAYKEKDTYQNTLKWAGETNYTEGSLWAAFLEGWNAAKDETPSPANDPEPPKVQELLTRDQRDALVAARAFLSTLQAYYENGSDVYWSVNEVRAALAGMLYE